MRSLRLAFVPAALLAIGISSTGLAYDPGGGQAAEKHGPGEPGTEPQPPGAPLNLPDRYRDTQGAHSERPGKHSTTAGRHGTSGEIGGGVDTQSGAGAAPSRDRVLERRQQEERDAEDRDTD